MPPIYPLTALATFIAVLVALIYLESSKSATPGVLLSLVGLLNTSFSILLALHIRRLTE